jgi:exopolyphosphatase/pppGpp-phosphohydrolase
LLQKYAERLRLYGSRQVAAVITEAARNAEKLASR